MGDWYLVSSHGAVLFYIAVNPGCTIRQIADAMNLTQRTIWGLIGDIRKKNMLSVHREGRTHHYTVDLNPGVEFTHPTLRDIPLKIVLVGLVDQFAVERKQ